MDCKDLIAFGDGPFVHACLIYPLIVERYINKTFQCQWK